MQSICVFCGSSIGALDIYRDDAKRMGNAIARRGMRLVYGGGKVGLMGVLADAALQAGGEVLGIIPEALMLKEVGHGSLTELVVTGTMHERKAAMADAADAFVALPGGFGTFDELCEILTWGQLGIHQKPVGLLDTAGFFSQLTTFFDFVERQGFVRPEHRELLLESTEPDLLLDQLAAWEPRNVAKWANLTAR
ncbi:MAG TPA: TIGR00730 family Rossman fold protein [Thermomicrobiales bacterium]|nr:TIGR00730 family Rossman fold protein [Thermomicrobiales bacterium]